MFEWIEDREYTIKRSVETGTEQQRKSVLSILTAVQNEGDRAVLRYTEQFDGVALSSIRVSDAEKQIARTSLGDGVREAMYEAARNIRSFHEKQTRQAWFTTEESGTMLGQMVHPLRRIGVYVPGGSAALFSTVLMTVIPAQVAGVEEIVLMTPPDAEGQVNSGVLAAAEELGIREVYKAGGAQAIGAMAYGTETVFPVDKIFGPGNIFVALAKREVFGVVDIDMIAGPSEVVVLADDTADPEYVAADLLSQAEHDPMSAAVLVTTSKTLAQRTEAEVEKQIQTLPRAGIAKDCLERHGAIYVVRSLEEGIEVVNELAPEHLELMIDDPMSYMGKIRHAGAVFLGSVSSEPIGDYIAGPSHVLPTNGTARFSSALSVDTFVKKTSIISYSTEDLTKNGNRVAAMARQEELEAHARAVEIRLQKEGERKSDETKRRTQGDG